MKIKLTICAALVALTGCAVEDPCAKSANPTECRRWSDAGGDTNDYLLYGMAGYMLGRANGGQTVIVRDPGYHGVYRQRVALPDARSQIIRQQRAKIERQRVELSRKQAANERYKSSYRSSSSRPSSFRSSGSSYRSSRSR